MVRLITKKNIKYITPIVYRILKLQEMFTYIREVNNPKKTPCIYVMWHSNQFCVHGLPNRNNVNVFISTSLDGEIVASVCENWGFKVCRGSSNRKGAVSGTLQMIDKLKKGEDIAIMVDGPRGPLHKVKHGAISLARETKLPIIPVHWYSPEKTFISLPSWDKMKTPIGPCHIMNIYGDPIYVENRTNEEVAEEIKNSLFELEKIAPDKFNEAKKQNLWK